MIYRARSSGRARAQRIGAATALSYKEAKARAEAIRGLVASGDDPVADEHARRQAARLQVAASIQECFSYYLVAHHGRLDAKTARAYQQTAEALPRAFTAMTAQDATPVLFREAVRAATSAPVMQNRHLSRFKTVLRFAHAEQRIQRLPAIVTMRRLNPESRRERVLSDAEIRALWQAADAVAPSMPRGGMAFAALVRILLLLGSRLGETTLATWAEFDLDGSAPRASAVTSEQPMWCIPAEHRKGEVGRKRPHWVPLSGLSASLLRGLQAHTGDKPLVFWKAAPRPWPRRRRRAAR